MQTVRLVAGAALALALAVAVGLLGAHILFSTNSYFFGFLGGALLLLALQIAIVGLAIVVDGMTKSAPAARAGAPVSAAPPEADTRLTGLCDQCADREVHLSNVYTFTVPGAPLSVATVSRLVCRECYVAIAEGDQELTRLAARAHQVASEYMTLHRARFSK